MNEFSLSNRLPVLSGNDKGPCFLFQNHLFYMLMKWFNLISKIRNLIWEQIFGGRGLPINFLGLESLHKLVCCVWLDVLCFVWLGDVASFQVIVWYHTHANTQHFRATGCELLLMIWQGYARAWVRRHSTHLQEAAPWIINLRSLAYWIPKLWGKIFSPGFDTFAILVPWYLRLWFSSSWDWCRLDLIFYSVSWIFDLFCLEGCAVQWSSCLIIRCTCTRSVLRLLSTILIIPVKWTMCTGKEMVGWSYLNFIIFTNKTCPTLNYYKMCIHHCKPKNNYNQFCWQASLSLDLQKSL